MAYTYNWDPVYARYCYIDPILQKLITTDTFVRGQSISQSTVPRRLIPIGSLPSRFYHGLGVYCLSQIVLRNNPDVPEILKRALPIACAMHDLGSPPFSHLSERFLKLDFGKNGETFLADMLARDSEAFSILYEHGLVEAVLLLVTGQGKPESDILHGSLDLDNIDNVFRHNYHCTSMGADTQPFDPILLADSFRFVDNQWCLLERAVTDIRLWQLARYAVYRQIYDNDTHFALIRMISRAIEIAYQREHIQKDFYYLNDDQAMQYLFETNPESRKLIDRTLRLDVYTKVVNEIVVPNEKTLSYVKNKLAVIELTDRLCERFNIPRSDMACSISKGNEGRAVTVPIIDNNDNRLDEYHFGSTEPEYRIALYIHDSQLEKKDRVREALYAELS